LLVVTDEQTAGRGRQGRRWQAPPGTSLMLSLLLRDGAAIEDVALLPLLTGVALAEAVETVVPGHRPELKWPNDLLIGEHKSAGILVEIPSSGAVVVGVGVNVDWRDVRRPAELSGATSLAEVAAATVDRWRLLAAFLERFDRRYTQWQADPRAFLPDYRRWCATLGRTVRVEQAGGGALTGTATAVNDSGALLVDAGGTTVEVRAGDVHHVRHR